MAKERLVVCKYYLNEKNCSKGREGTFWQKCQKCNLYEAKHGVLPVHKENKKSKEEKIRKKEAKKDYESYKGLC